MLEAALLVSATCLLQDQTKDVGYGASEMAGDVNIPLSEEPDEAKGLHLPLLDILRTPVNHKKGAQARGSTALRSLLAETGLPNKVLPEHIALVHGPDHSIFEHDILLAPLNDAARFLRDFGEQLNVTFEPAAAMTFQHATKVVDNAPHTRGLLWYGADGHMRLWDNNDGIGEIVYNLQGNVGLGTPFAPIMGANVGNPLANNNIIISKDFGLYMLYWQQSFMDDKLRARAGKMEFQAFFDRNAIAYDPVGGFLAQNFNQSSAIPFPDYGFAGIVAYDFDSNFTARIGVQNSMSSGITTGFDGMSAHNLFSILELDWRVWEPWGEDKREGHRRLMIWHTGIDDPFSGGGELSGWGVAFNMDQSISNDAAVFCRIGWGQEAVTPMRVAISGGFAVESVLPHVDMGVAGGWGEVTRLGRSDLADPSTPVGDQWLFEWYANMHVTPTLHMGPVVQVVLDKAADVDASIVYGWRASWAY